MVQSVSFFFEVLAFDQSKLIKMAGTARTNLHAMVQYCYTTRQ